MTGGQTLAGPAEHVQNVVIGSGFGGSVVAYRLAEAGKPVVVLERGKRYPPGSFPRPPFELNRAMWDPSRGLHGMFDVWSFRGLGAVVAAGLGGGSLIYANVLLRKEEDEFVVEDPDTGRWHWPVGRADLDPHYKEVERMLAPQRFPLGARGYGASGKTVAMRDAANKSGLDWQLPPLAVTFGVGDGAPAPGMPIPPPSYGNLHGQPRATCRLTGECDIGCNVGSKNSLDHTYLSAAAHHNAEIRVRCEARSIMPTDRGWAVRYVSHENAEEGQPCATSQLPERVLTCDRLILAAGTLGSTYLLLRSKDALPKLSSRIGHRYCGNGDLLGFAFDTRDGGRPRRLGATQAPVITSAVRGSDDNGHGFYIEDAGYPGFVDWLLEAADAPGLARRSAAFAWDWAFTHLLRKPESALGGRLAGLLGTGDRSASSMPLLGMGHDTPDGRMRLRGRWLDVDWTTRASQPYFARAQATMAELTRRMGGRFEPNPLSRLGRVLTVHSLGGAPMGHTARDGVVDSYGQVFGHPNLYVVDGAAMPGPVGPNPSLTIAAFADRAATAMLAGRQ